MESEKLKIYENRILVANLIIDVLLNRKTVEKALVAFPKDKNDIDIKCAFDALLHREADEDLRKKDADYALVQDDYLMDLAEILKNNERLPQNIIQEYLNFHHDDLISPVAKTLKQKIQKLKRMINF